MLKQRDAKGEVVTLKVPEVLCSVEGKPLSNTLVWRRRNRTQVFQKAIRTNQVLIDLDDHAMLIHKERTRKRKISATIVKVTIQDVIDSGDFVASKQHGKRHSLTVDKRSQGCHVAVFVDVHGRTPRPVQAQGAHSGPPIVEFGGL